MKKVIIMIIIIVIAVITIISVLSKTPKEDKNVEERKIENVTSEIEQFSNVPIDVITNNIDNKVEEGNMVYLKINNQVLDIELEDNSATKELVEKLKDGDVVINAEDYGGFEKVGSLGFSLPREDTNIKTTAGDIVLYQGNQISIFYNNHSWSYTKIGKVHNISVEELKTILGNGDVTLTFTLYK